VEEEGEEADIIKGKRWRRKEKKRIL